VVVAAQYVVYVVDWLKPAASDGDTLRSFRGSGRGLRGERRTLYAKKARESTGAGVNDSGLLPAHA